jgi:DNA processing protein
MFTLTELPDRLKQIPDPPKQLFIRGESLENLLQKPCLTVVGSRRVSPYGREITNRLVTDVSRAGVVIISGLAFGVDALAHRAALEAGGPTIAVLPTSIDNIQPASHRALAESIIERGGALVSEYACGAFVQKWNFVQRNRIASGLSHATLITEAGERSGTLHTASFALDQGREVLAVPGNITSPTSVGTNNLIKMGATPVTASSDILRALGVVPTQARGAILGDTPEEQLIIDLLSTNVRGGDELQKRSGLNISQFNQTMTMLEITGKISPLGGDNWTLAN